MSLDFSFEDIKDYKTVCFDNDVEEGHNNDLDCLIWGCLMLDMKGITEQNIQEWVFRLNFIKETGGYLWKNHEGENWWPNMGTLEKYTGLRTNVKQTTRKQYIKKQTDFIINKVQRKEAI